MPRKVFTAGEVLAAADVNEYLMDQTVMSFAGTAARGSAIGTAVEGMVTYLNDSDSLELYNGSAWVSATPSSGAATNAIINGAFEVNQRNFTSSTAGNYGFDRWDTARSGGTVTASSETFTLGAAPVAGIEAKNYQRTVTSGQSASSDYAVLVQKIEDVRSFAGQTVTVSFYARSGSGTPKIGIELFQNFGTGGSPSADVSTALGAPTISTAWTRYTATVAIPSISGKTLGTTNNNYLGLGLWVSAGSTFNTRASSIGIQNNTFDIWGVQVEAGSTATPFRRNANSLQGELAACQRYYFRNTPGNTQGMLAQGSAFGTTGAFILVNLPVTMRALASSVDFSTLRLTDGVNNITVTALTLTSGNVTTTQTVSVDATVASGLTQFRPYILQNGNSTAGFIGFSAEL